MRRLGDPSISPVHEPWPLIRRRSGDAVSHIAREMRGDSYFQRVCLLLHHPRRVGICHSSSLV
jgi:hypothetical protein